MLFLHVGLLKATSRAILALFWQKVDCKKLNMFNFRRQIQRPSNKLLSRKLQRRRQVYVEGGGHVKRWGPYTPCIRKRHPVISWITPSKMKRFYFWYTEIWRNWHFRLLHMSHRPIIFYHVIFCTAPFDKSNATSRTRATVASFQHVAGVNGP